MSDVTTPNAEVAVSRQFQIIVRTSHGELELGQEYDGEWHGIYAHPDNVLRLAGAILRTAGMDDLYLYRQKPSGLCNDVDWPDGASANEDVNEFEVDLTTAKPKDPTAAERQRRRRAKKRDSRDVDRDSVAVTPVTVTDGHALPLLEYQELAG
jgi:hypothetical protein